MRKFFAKVHLWLSIPFGIIIAIVCLTGAILVFETEILELGYPSRYFVKKVKGEPLSPATLIESARQQLPDSVRINGIRVSSIVGYATLVLAIIIISGIVIWYPRNKKVLRNRLKVKTKAGWFRFFYDLHVSGGFYAALLLLILALTGLTWSFGWYRNAFYSVFGISANPPQAHHAPASSGAKKPAKKKTDYTQWAEVLSALKSHYPDFNSITIQDGSATVSTARYGNTRGSDRYSFDPATGEITEVQLYKDLPKSGKIRGWIYSVHVGSWGGMTTRILTCLVSLLGTIFAITGYYFWIKKQFRKLR